MAILTCGPGPGNRRDSPRRPGYFPAAPGMSGVPACKEDARLMRVVITGGAGFIGRRLALRLLELNALTDSAGREQPVERIVLFDRAAPDPRLLHDPRVEAE